MNALAERLRAGPDWLYLRGTTPPGARCALPWAAGQRSDPGAPVLWRREFLLALTEAGLLPAEADEAALEGLALRAGAVAGPAGMLPDLSRVPPGGRRVLLISRFGIHKFGGAEQFLEQMAHLYAAMGYAPLVLGTAPEFQGQSGTARGLPYAYVPMTPEALLRVAVEEQAAIVHVVSGQGLEVAVALRWLAARLIFGVHFWREMFEAPTANGGYFPDIDQAATPRPAFDIVLEDYGAIYANSTFSRDLLERHFRLIPPVIPSLPDDEFAPAAPFAARDLVLLANTRTDKGFDILLRAAALLPEVRFVALASQARREVAEGQAAGLANVTILDRVEEMAPLYRRARVALVPSFHFIESFSRICIEAQRHGTPVIGADRGNIPALLAESGTVLPEDPARWAAAIARLWHDPQAWAEASVAAIANSRRHAFAPQRSRLEGLVAGIETPMLVGVGSGIGNIVHATPMIRNIVRRLGRRVDVVVNGDTPEALAVVAGSEWVNDAFLLTPPVLRRRYDTVLLTHSFGGLLPPFATPCLRASRDVDIYRADHALHETEFNLAMAERLLGIPYDAADTHGYFLGAHRWRGSGGRLVGMHGGSKPGAWAAKRWPHFPELAARLMELGYEVASFGTPDEHVPGTRNMTGGTVAAMIDRIAGCAAFVSNDSGLMNIANALGMPLLALFAPTNPRTRGPNGPASLALRLQKPCVPCELAGPQGPFHAGGCNCIGEISVVDALGAFLRLPGLPIPAGPVAAPMATSAPPAADVSPTKAEASPPSSGSSTASLAPGPLPEAWQALAARNPATAPVFSEASAALSWLLATPEAGDAEAGPVMDALQLPGAVVSIQQAIALRRNAAEPGLPAARRAALLLACWHAWGALVADPAHGAQARFEQAVCSYRLRNYARAEEELAPLLAKPDAPAKAWLLASRVLVALNRITEAEAATEAVAALDPAQHSIAYHRQVLPGLRAPSVSRATPGGLLVAVGGGLGNMLHAGPMIANIARRTGHRPEVVVAEEQPGRLFLFNDPRYVTTVHPLNQALLTRRFDVVLVTGCFGDLPVPFEAGRVSLSLDWDRFSGRHRLHEAVFNLEAARALLGIDHAPEDATRYFVGEVPPPRHSGTRIGLHAGSKGGYWVAKRWSHFEALATALQARGYEVVSFGGAGEHVPGTVDLTGGTLRAMAEGLAACRHVVSNDSGVMNLAHAIGVPLTALFGPTDPRTRGPLRPGSTVLAAAEPCEATAEGLKRLQEGRSESIASLTFDEVLAHVLTELARPIDRLRR